MSILKWIPRIEYHDMGMWDFLVDSVVVFTERPVVTGLPDTGASAPFAMPRSEIYRWVADEILPHVYGAAGTVLRMSDWKRAIDEYNKSTLR